MPRIVIRGFGFLMPHDAATDHLTTIQGVESLEFIRTAAQNIS